MTLTTMITFVCFALLGAVNQNHGAVVTSLAPEEVESFGDKVFVAAEREFEDQCIFDDDCGHGKCVLKQTRKDPNGTHVCECDQNYIDHDGQICNYEKKNRVIAFIFSFILGALGTDWFYLAEGNSEYNGIGVLKLLMLPILCVVICVVICGAFPTGSLYMKSCAACIGCLVVAGYITWYFVDWIRIAADPCNFKDGNGVCLGDW